MLKIGDISKLNMVTKNVCDFSQGQGYFQGLNVKKKLYTYFLLSETQPPYAQGVFFDILEELFHDQNLQPPFLF